ncbi:MAG: hypothetical protein EU530_07365 [Promethearchaeota archaeon]|nr:MAG: hypothetical protein EU530_07365 [Candidatus Lokiarchaeota archaeon]
MIKWLKIIIDKKYKQIDEISVGENVSKKTLFNKLRDMQILNLIDYENGVIKISIGAKNALLANKLQDLLKTQLFKNQLLIDTLNESANNPNIDYNDVIQLLKLNFPFIEATSKTWEVYTKNFIKWLKFCGFDQELPSRLFDKAPTRESKNEFYPLTSIQKAKTVLAYFEGNDNLSKSNRDLGNLEKIIPDLLKLQVIQKKNKDYILTDIGRKLVDSPENIRIQHFKSIILEFPNIRHFLRLIRVNQSLTSKEIFRKSIKEFQKCWSDESIKWYYKNIKSWLLYTGLVLEESYDKLIELYSKKGLDRFMLS